MANFKQLIKKIEAAESVHELKHYHQELFQLPNSPLLSHTPVTHIFSSLNHVHDLLMQRAIQIAEKELKSLNRGKCPEQWCFYLLGSAARSEQTIWTDQDNGILYLCSSEDAPQCKRYIDTLAVKITAYLHDIGYKYCPGNVMATNPRWTKEATQWIEAMTSHAQACSPDDIRYLYIAADLRPLYGDDTLIFHVQKQLYQLINGSPFTTSRMQTHTAVPKVPLNALGVVHGERWGEHSGEINIKTSLYVPLINSIKYLAIRHQITATSTLERLEALKNKGIITERIFKEIEEALITSLYFRLYSSLDKEDSANYIHFEKLSKQERKALKSAMKLAKHWQGKVFHWNGANQDE
ncbi:signal-transduction protein with cAMP-binding, CBS, and nucleotidyltransferase domain [Pullulanibacillus pueri]|uniref:Nucleotidyltransferase n=1 Tax=Pullulanibacillus pueri TaxID=1437324 RepID=A0A8J2ZUL6_9BACL|nr:DUF294 nucleotidyltransferase-like domain-containing protein [Pullulanibacillus pueri]MBM7680776.1 signal-transduction protein with cAMP-binding, CBS, and nucleotidyltransferase domain [Pullulanibacillus pueri]GGH78287.1 hypothetical protein GCM10007096_11480 [Pullulanibacillus pueri]